MNNDGDVDPADVVEVLAEWGPGSGLSGDVNCDGNVDAAHRTLVLGNSGLCLEVDGDGCLTTAKYLAWKLETNSDDCYCVQPGCGGVRLRLG